MKLRVFVRISVAAIVLLVLFGGIHHPVQAETNSYVSFRALDKRTTLIDTLTMTSSDLTTIMAYSETRLYDICAPLQESRSDPSIGPDWLIQLTVVVIVMCASIGAIGTRLTRAAPGVDRD